MPNSVRLVRHLRCLDYEFARIRSHYHMLDGDGYCGMGARHLKKWWSTLPGTDADASTDPDTNAGAFAGTNAGQ